MIVFAGPRDLARASARLAVLFLTEPKARERLKGKTTVLNADEARAAGRPPAAF